MLVRTLGTAALIALAVTPAAHSQSVESAMDAIVSRLYSEFALDELSSLTENDILDFITPEERDALATQHVHFDVSVPVVVSVMRHERQSSVPFWLPEADFEKTGLRVTNTEDWVYEVWQKEFPAGHVGLGINGFDKHRPHYFVAVGPQNPGDTVTLTNVFPEFSVGWMHEGASVYHDWTSLLLKEVPEELEEHLLLTTIRGRAREAHLIGGFRTTPYPASNRPDQVVLSWTEDPTTTQTVQWRGSMETRQGELRYRSAGSNGEFLSIAADRFTISDRFLANDPKCQKFTANIRDLQPATTYEYHVGFKETDAWSEPAEFTTAPAEDVPFTFIAFGDTQSIEPWAPVLNAALERHPDAAFATIAGDVVDVGQDRDQWDRFFHVAQPMTRQWPLMPALGNHDVIDGLGSEMWRASLALPQDGPAHLEPERVYAFEYSNALILVLDSTLDAIDQAAWLEQRLAESDADWKIAVFHFPPYNYEHAYPEIASLWGYIFDKFDLDLAIEGHVHYYMRSKPIYQGKPSSDGRGTTHLITIPTAGREHDLPLAPYAEVQFTGVGVYQAIEIDANTLRCRAIDAEGKVHDEFTLNN